MVDLNGHEAGNGGHSQGEPNGTSPVLDPTIPRRLTFSVSLAADPVRTVRLFGERVLPAVKRER